LAQARWDKGDRAAAEALYRQWLDFEPDNVGARAQLGIVLFAAERYEDAYEQLDLAYAAGNRDDGVPELRAISLAKMQRYAEAIALLAPLVEAAPQVLATTSVLADAHLQTGDRQKAAAVYEGYLAAAPADDPNRATAERKLKELTGQPL
ncbi:MAG TPA: tetratricopeptide repeat protein, partial [Devosia sp.]